MPFDEHIFPEDVFLSSMVTDQAIPQPQQEIESNATLPASSSQVAQNDVPGTSSTTCTPVTPENVRPYLKAVLGKEKLTEKV